MEYTQEGDAWKSIDTILRHIDEGKVKDCTTDIDSLLTFAGLYSAILTAFLVESYKNLSPDPQQTMIALLREISSQTHGYSIHPGFINTTASLHTTPPAFSAARSDIRINVCWFSSLVLSLSTASFGILVKQWLREYLAIDRTVPQERIRIRHFRRHGLEKWKLYEIAAVLPLVLQLSLAVFFVGLCFFTVEVHPSVGKATVVLVSGWAFFLVFAVFAPILSAHCPYRTKFLRGILEPVRRHVVPIIKSLAGSPTQLLLRVCLDNLTRHIHCVVEVIELSLRRYTSGSTLNPEQIAAEVGGEGTSFIDETWVVLHCFKQYPLEEKIPVREEDEIRRTDEHDVKIMKKVDLMLSDDSLLKTIRAALQRRPPAGESVLRLVVNAVRYRLGIQDYEANSEEFRRHGLNHITPAACMSFMNVLADAILHQLSISTVEVWHTEPARHRWMDDALLLIIALAPPRATVQKTVTVLYRQLLGPSADSYYPGCALFAERVFTTVAGQPTSEAWRVRVLSNIAEALKQSDPQSLACIVDWSYLDRRGEHKRVKYESNAYQQILQGDNVSVHTLVALLELAAVILYGIAQANQGVVAKRRPDSMPPEARQLLEFVVRAVPLIEQRQPPSEIDLTQPRVPGGVGLDQLFMTYFTTPSLVYTFLECLGSYPDVLSAQVSNQILHDPLSRIRRTHNLSCDAQASILYACAEYCKVRQRSRSLSLVSTLRLCFLVISFHTEDDEIVTAHWREVFSVIEECLTSLWSQSEAHRATVPSESNTVESEAEKMAYRILKTIDGDTEDRKKPFRVGRPDNERSHLTEEERAEEDRDETVRYSRWLVQFTIESSPYHDEFVRVLRSISSRTTDSHGRTFWRVRRLEDLERASGSGNS